MELKNYEEAIEDFQNVMDKEPNNGEVNSDLKYARVAFEKAGGKKKFKKITIVEEEEDEE